MTTKSRIYGVIVKPTASGAFRALHALDPDAILDLEYCSVKADYYQIQTNAVIDMVLNKEDSVIEYRCWLQDADGA